MIVFIIIVVILAIAIGSGHLSISGYKYDNFHDLLEGDENKAKKVFHIGKENK